MIVVRHCFLGNTMAVTIDNPTDFQVWLTFAVRRHPICEQWTHIKQDIRGLWFTQSSKNETILSRRFNILVFSDYHIATR